jgi:cob(I)alamin adenosyltransferase
MKIYTKTGDKGKTGIIGKRLSKNSEEINFIGELDELNAHVGLCVNLIDKENPQGKTLIKTQENLFSIGAKIAGGNIGLHLEEETQNLEDQIDKLDKKLPKLQNFILPGGTQSASQIHITRAVCRRVERKFVAFYENLEKTKELHKQILKYLNRLSDYLFVLARFENHEAGEEEKIWN